MISLSKFILFVREAHSWKQEGYFRSRTRFFGKNYTKKFAQLLPTSCLAWGNAFTFRSSEVNPLKKLLTYLLKDSGSSTTSLLLVRLQTPYEKLQKLENNKTQSNNVIFTCFSSIINATRDSSLEDRGQIHSSCPYSRWLLSNWVLPALQKPARNKA